MKLFSLDNEDQNHNGIANKNNEGPKEENKQQESKSQRKDVSQEPLNVHTKKDEEIVIQQFKENHESENFTIDEIKKGLMSDNKILNKNNYYTKRLDE